MKRLFIIGIGLSLAVGAAACGGGTSSADKTSTAGAGGAKTPVAGATKAATAAATTAPATKAAATTAATKAAEKPTESTEVTPAAGPAPTKAELTADIASLKTIMTATIAKAQAGDVQGTRDTEGTMDKAMEAVVTATRAVDPNLATTLENLELDIEKQADASNTDLSVIIKDAQAVPAVLDQCATALKLTP